MNDKENSTLQEQSDLLAAASKRGEELKNKPYNPPTPEHMIEPKVPLDRSKSVVAYHGSELIEQRAKELLKYPSERITLDHLNTKELIAFATNKPSQEVRNKSRDIINGSKVPDLCRMSEQELLDKYGYKAGSDQAAEIEKHAQLLAYVEMASSDSNNKYSHKAENWLDRYYKSIQNAKNYLLFNFEEAKKGLKEAHKYKVSAECIADSEADCLFGSLLLQVFKCAEKIDPELQKKVAIDLQEDADIASSDRAFLFSFGIRGIFGAFDSPISSESSLGSNSQAGNIKICIAASVVAIVLTTSLGIGLGLGL